MKWLLPILSVLCIAATPLTDPRFRGHATFDTGATIDFANATILNLSLDSSGWALDADVVHNSGNEAIAGIKTFSSAPGVPDNSFNESKVTNLLTDLAARQPLNVGLTAIAALTTDPFGLALLTKTSAGSIRTYIGAGTSNFDGAFASLTGKPTNLAGYGITDAQGLDNDLTAIAGLTTDAFGRALLTKADPASIRTYIGAGTSSFTGAFTELSNIPTTLAGYGITDAQAATYDYAYPSGTAVASYTARDNFNDVYASYAIGDTITSLISGTLITYSTAPGGLFYRVNHELHIVNEDVYSGVSSGTTFSHTAGNTVVAYFKTPDVTSGSVGVGFISSALAGGTAMSNGIRIGAVGGGAPTASVVVIVGGSTNYRLFDSVALPGETYGCAVKLTAGGWEAWVQGGYFERYGCKLYSDNWLKIYTSSSTISGTLKGAVESRLTNIDVPVQEVSISTSFNPSDRRAAIIEADTTLYDTHTGAAVYDTAGNLWEGWFKGSSDSGVDGVTRVGCRLANGTRLATVTVNTSSGDNREDCASLSIVNGQVWLVSNTTTDAFVTATPKRRILTISGGAISVGSPASFSGVAAGFTLTYNRIYTTADSHLILPLASETQWWTAVSSNNGATWTEGTKYSGIEPTVCEEPNGTLAAYIRVAHATNANVPRYTSANNGSTWTSGGSLTGVPSNDSRYSAIKSPSGTVLIVGCDSAADFVRTYVTAWEIGDGGTVLSKIPLTDLSSANQNYPAIAVYNNKLSLLCPIRSNGSGVPGMVLVAERTLDEWVGMSDTNRSLQALGGVARSGINADILRMPGLAYGTAALPTLGTATGGAVNFLSDRIQFLINGVETDRITSNGITLIPSGAAVVVPADGDFLFTGRGGLVFPADGVPKFINWAGTEVALPISSGGTGITSFGTGIATFLGTPTSANLAAAVTDENGSGKLLFAGGTIAIPSGKTLTVSNTLTFAGTDASSVAFGAGGTVLYSGGVLGTPSSGTLTNATGLPVSTGISGLGAGVATALAIAANGSGGFVTDTGTVTLSSKTLTTPVIAQINGTVAALTTALNNSSGGSPGLGLASSGALVGQFISSNTGVMDIYGGAASSVHFANWDASANQTLYGNVGAPIFNATTGFRIGNAATTAHYLRGNGTNYVDSAIQAGDIPTLNQSTTGSAASLTTARAIYGNNFDGTAALTQIIASTYGGTGNGFTKFSGPTTAERTKTLRDATDTILELGGSYTPTGTWTNMTLVTPALGTPASGTLTNATGLPITGITSSSSAQLRTLLSDENGTGAALFDSATSPTFITPILGTPTSGNLANCTFPTLNQSTTGSAATLTTTRAIYGNNFNGSADVTGGIATTFLPDGITNSNTARQSQAVTSGTAYYITSSNLALPASLKAGMAVGTKFTWHVHMDKTAAGTGTFQIIIYRGTNGSTSDTADVTQTIGTQTAVADNMVMDVTLVVTTTGATGAYFWKICPMQQAATASGFGIVTGTTGLFTGTVSSVAMNTSALIFGLGFKATTGTPTISVPMVEGQAINID